MFEHSDRVTARTFAIRWEASNCVGIAEQWLSSADYTRREEEKNAHAKSEQAPEELDDGDDEPNIEDKLGELGNGSMLFYKRTRYLHDIRNESSSSEEDEM